jgi:sodium-dependent dicarboxylate transporter 2/3/5
MTSEPYDARGRVRKLVALVAGPALFLIILAFPAPTAFAPQSWLVLGLAAWMMVWWTTGALPLFVTALLPITVLPLSGTGRVPEIAGAYVHPLIILFLGGFLVAKAVERWSLHRQIASAILPLGGAGPTGLVGSMMLATAFLSMWLSNTATAMVMVPIAGAIVQALPRKTNTNEGSSSLGASLMLGVALSSTIGGMATLIGTPPNALMAAYLEETHGIAIGFWQWMLLGVPVSAALLLVCWLLLTRFAFNLADWTRDEITAAITRAMPAQTALSSGARRTAIVGAVTGAALVFKPVLNWLMPGLGLEDAEIAILGAAAVLLLPSGDPDGSRLLGWREARGIRWDVLILFGGGLALAEAIDSSGLSLVIGSGLATLGGMPIWFVILLAMVAMVFLGELASNTAMAAVFLPVASAVALSMGVAATDVVLPIGLAASLGFMLPVATPPNAIVFSTGVVSATQMLRTGLVLDLVSIAVVFILVRVVGSLIIPT